MDVIGSVRYMQCQLLINGIGKLRDKKVKINLNFWKKIIRCNAIDAKIKMVIWTYFTSIGAMFKFTIKLQYSYFL